MGAGRMRIVLVGRKHARCRRCGLVHHFPWAEASSADMAMLGWVARLRRGCADCRGPLEKHDIDECADCDQLLAEAGEFAL